MSRLCALSRAASSLTGGIHLQFLRARADLYGHRHDCLESLVELVRTLAKSWDERTHELKEVDKQRLMKAQWYMSQNMVRGGLSGRVQEQVV